MSKYGCTGCEKTFDTFEEALPHHNQITGHNICTLPYDNECSVHGPFFGQVCVSCAEVLKDNNCNLHGPFHGMVCSVCFNSAKGMSILASNPPDEIDHTYTSTLEREIERLLYERQTTSAKMASLRAALSRAEAAEAQLCRAREWLVTAKTLNGTECSHHDPHRKKYAIKERCGKCILCLIDYAITVHLSPAPCPHEIELKIAREIVAGQEAEK